MLIVAPLFIRGEAEFGVIPQSSMADDGGARVPDPLHDARLDLFGDGRWTWTPLRAAGLGA